MSELRERCAEWIRENFSERRSDGQVYDCQLDALESFAKAEQIKGMQAVKAECEILRLERKNQAQRQEIARFREALKDLVAEVASYTTNRYYYSREQASKDLDRREAELISKLHVAQAVLT